MNKPAMDVVFDNEPVELYKILKVAGVVASGGEAKHLIAGGEVRVDGEVETRKRRKTFFGSVIEAGGQSIRLQSELPPCSKDDN